MKRRLLAPPSPVRSTPLPWNALEGLPPEKPDRKKKAADYTVSAMPQKFTFVLVDVVAEDLKLSKGKARKAITRGKVTVDGSVVTDPDVRVDGDAKIVFHP